MEVSIELDEIKGEWWTRERKVGKHKRKLNGEEYISPRIVLSSDYNDFIGKKFEVYTAKGKISEEYFGSKTVKEGTMLILFFPEKVTEERRDVDGDFDWGDDDYA